MSSEIDNVLNAQIANTVSNIKSRLSSATASELCSLSITLDNLASMVDSPELEAKIRGLQADVVEKAQREVSQLSSRIYTYNDIKTEEVSEKDRAFLENEEREKRIDLLAAIYISSKDDFHKQLQEENTLLTKAVNGELTNEERNKLLGVYSSKEEEEAAKKNDQKSSETWKVHYELRREVKESISYREDAINKNNKLIEDPKLSSEEKSKLIKDIENHKQVISQQKKKQEYLKPAQTEREQSRKQIITLATIDPNLVVNRAAKHYQDHTEGYKEDLQEAGHESRLAREIRILEKLAELKSSGKPLTREQISDILKESSAELSTNDQNVKIEATKVHADSIKETLSANSSPLKAPATPIVPSNKRLQHGNTEVKKGWVK